MRNAFSLALLVMLCGLTLVASPPAHAQITRQIDTDIPFSFFVQDTKLPAGKYTVKMRDDTDLGIMEIQSANDKESVMFEVADSQAESVPTDSELIFKRCGKNEYLSRIYDSGNKYGSRIPMTKSVLNLRKSGIKAVEHPVTGKK